MKQAFLVPVDGAHVRDPISFEVLPPEGALKDLHKYWLRALVAGSVKIVNKDEKGAA